MDLWYPYYIRNGSLALALWRSWTHEWFALKLFSLHCSSWPSKHSAHTPRHREYSKEGKCKKRKNWDSVLGKRSLSSSWVFVCLCCLALWAKSRIDLRSINYRTVCVNLPSSFCSHIPLLSWYTMLFLFRSHFISRWDVVCISSCMSGSLFKCSWRLGVCV